MMKYLFLVYFFCINLTTAFAEEALEIEQEEKINLASALIEDDLKDEEEQVLEEEKLIPIILSEPFIKLSTETVFNADSSKLISLSTHGNPVYVWDFGDGSAPKYGKEMTYQYENVGKYVVKLTVKQGKEKESITKDVFVYDKKGVLISDNIEEISEVVLQAAGKGLWLKEITFNKTEGGFSIEDAFIQKIQENAGFINESIVFISHTDSVLGMQSFARFWQKLSPENKFDVKEKLWIQLVKGSLDQVAKLTQPLFQIIEPRFILLTRMEALNPIFEQPENIRVTENLAARAIEYRIIDERSRTNPVWIFSRLVTYFVSHGISQNVVYLLLVVPFLTFVTAFSRQVVGISTFGVYAPLVLSLSFFVLGLEFGLSVFVMTLVVSYLIRVLFERVELLYIPRLSLLLSALALSFFLVLGLAVYFQTSLNLSLAIFPMLVMSTISEKFLFAQSEEGIKNAIVVAGETVVVSLIGYFLFDIPFFKEAILATPEYVVLPIIGNILLGKFTGLRWAEYFKFRTLLREDSQE